MLGKDLHDLIKVVKMINPIVGNNTTEGTPAASLDTKGFQSAEVIAHFGVSGDTLSGSLKVDLIAQHSDNDSDWSAITDASYLIGATPDGSGIVATIDNAAEDPALHRVGYKGPKRYFRCIASFTGTHTNGMPISMIGILSGAKYPPTSD